MKTIRNILFLCLFISLSSALYAQEEDIQREVRVIKPYTPTLSDAEKINLLPVFDDTLRVRPDYNYRINPKPFETQFKVRPIQPARMVGLPLEHLYKSQLTLGFGNYLSPFAELSVNQLRSRRSSLGLYLRHQSSAGKIKLENDQKVPAHYSDNLLKLYGKQMYYRSVLEGGITGGYNSLMYYGFNTEAVDTMLEKKNIQQKIYSSGGNIRFYSTHPDSLHFNYDFGGKYMYTRDAFQHAEHALRTSATLSTFFGDWFSGIDLGVDYYGKSEGIDTSDNMIVKIDPWTSKASDQWRVLFGIRSAIDYREEGSLSLYPRISFEFNIVDDVLIPYMGLDGYKEVNNYRKILFENPYIKPGLNVANTDHSIIGYVGLKGRYSSKMAFDLKVSYSNIDSMYFYVNDTTTVLQNQFDVVYDYASLLRAGAEIMWNQNERLRFILHANYYHYELDDLEHPWHRPVYDASLRTSYNLRDKILVDADLFLTGKRYAPSGIPGMEADILDPFLDANLSVEYRYTKVLSFFLRFNNLAASKYSLWNQYPVQRFQLIGGFSYAL